MDDKKKYLRRSLYTGYNDFAIITSDEYDFLNEKAVVAFLKAVFVLMETDFLFISLHID